MTADLNRSLSHRLRTLAESRGVDAARLRRHLAFQRLLARLAPTGAWVLKGGYSLEVRFDLTGRATQDLDLALVPGLTTGVELRDLLEDHLEEALPDGFGFRIRALERLRADKQGTPGWRVRVESAVQGRSFEVLKLDVVQAAREVAGAVEALVVDPVVTAPGFTPVHMPAVDVAQQAAEKVHAYARVYARDRPSSRVKDLVDLALLVDAGILDGAAWARRTQHVFDVRDRARPPARLPEPPSSWAVPYASLADGLAVPTDVTSAWRLVDRAYRDGRARPDG